MVRWIGRTKPDNIQDSTKLAKKVIGGKIDRSFKMGIQGLDKLMEKVRAEAARGYITALDGRRIPVRHEHAALNTLLQGNAAVIAKKWTNLAYDEVKRRKIDAWIAAFVHDELSSQCEEPRAEELGQVVLSAIPVAGRHFNLNIRLDGEVKIGNSWAEAH